MESKVVRTFLIPSKSVPGDRHTVEVYKNGEIKCECIRSFYRMKCNHIREVEKLLKEEKE